MTGTITRFPTRHAAVVWLLQASEGAWSFSLTGTAGCTGREPTRSQTRAGSPSTWAAFRFASEHHESRPQRALPARSPPNPASIQPARCGVA